MTEAEPASAPSPLVSVVIPTRDRPDLLLETLASLESQSLEQWEAIVVVDTDDAETTRRLRMMVERRYGSNRVKVLSRPAGPGGASACRNVGLRRSTAPFVLFLDDDDLLSDECLRDRVGVLMERPDLDMVVGQCRLFTERTGDDPFFWNEFSEESDLDRQIRGDPPWNTHGPLWRRSFLAPLDGFDERASSWQDWEYYIRALAAGCKYARLDRLDCWWRRTRSGTISSGQLVPVHVVNRLHTIRRVVDHLQTIGQLTPRRWRAVRGRCTRLILELSGSAHLALSETLDIARTASALGLVDTVSVACVRMMCYAREKDSSFFERLFRRLLRERCTLISPVRPSTHLCARQMWSNAIDEREFHEGASGIRFDIRP